MYLKNPLEPWDLPNAPSAKMLYAKIMRADDGTLTLDDFSSVDLDYLRWLEGEQLVGIGTEGTVHMLDDPDAKTGRKYPGAPEGDKRAAVGKQLRDRAMPLILAALLNFKRGRTLTNLRGADLRKSGGMALPARLVCQEANKLKAKRSDLDEYRYLHVATCARLLRDMCEAGALEEIEPPKAIRSGRKWITLPRVYNLDTLPDVPSIGSVPLNLARAA
jgi:hypothetical protein